MFDGFLLYGKSGNNYIPFPHQFIKKDSVSISPELRTELQAYRDGTNYLRRITSPNRKADIKFTLVKMTQDEMEVVQNWFRSCISNLQEAKLTIRMYKPNLNGYADLGFFYKVDETYNISCIKNNKLYYNEMDIEFIMY